MRRRTADQRRGALAVFQVLGGNGHERLGIDQTNKIGHRSNDFAVDLGVQMFSFWNSTTAFLPAPIFTDAFKRHAAEVEAVARFRAARR